MNLLHEKPMIKKFYTTHEVSKFCNVYPTTVINWVKEGLLPAYTTPGGHRRIKREDILSLMKKNNMPIPDELSKTTPDRVLIIDDDPKILKMMQTIFLQEGLAVSTAGSGFEAGLLISSWLPDIIILDFLMPEMDGFEVCRRLQSDERTKDIPIIAVTDLKEPEQVKKMYSTGITDYISKPFKSEELVGKIKKHLSVE